MKRKGSGGAAPLALGHFLSFFAIMAMWTRLSRQFSSTVAPLPFEKIPNSVKPYTRSVFL
jgi:hypothetical protein